MSSDGRSRGWCFTINNYTELHVDIVYAQQFEPDCTYIVCGREVGESGTPHLQGFIYHKNKKSFAQMRDVCPSAHWEPMKGTALQASQYCKKDGDFWEHGSIPMSQEKKGEAGAEWWKQQVEHVAARRYDEVDPQCLIQNFSGLHKAASVMFPPVLEDTEETHLWYYGDAGTGKSRKARGDNPGAYLKMCNKWWDGYTNQDVVLIEDFDKDHHVLCHHLKIWGDRYPFPAEIKGGKIDIRPRKIIVTSNYHPNEIWENEKDLNPILRRFKIEHFSKF